MIVPWEHCPSCGRVDGVHTHPCSAASACVTVGCGRVIEGDSEMREDGLCNSCSETFIRESLVAEEQDLSCSRCLHAGAARESDPLPSCALMDANDVGPRCGAELQQAVGAWRHLQRRAGDQGPARDCPGMKTSRPAPEETSRA